MCAANIETTILNVLVCYFNSAEIVTEADLLAESKEEYLQGSYSPKLIGHKDLTFDTMIYDPEEDMAKLEQARKQLVATGSAEVSHTKRRAPFASCIVNDSNSSSMCMVLFGYSQP